MNWFSKMERKFGRYAIHNLMYYILFFYGAGVVLSLAAPMFYWAYLSLDWGMILKGQVWRLITFLMQAPSSGLLWSLVIMYCYYMMGTTLERTWGAFRFNVYYFSGVLATIVASLVLYLIFRSSYPLGTTFINLALFFGLAITYPNTQFLLFFLIPVKASWLAIAEAGIYLYLFIVGGTVTRIEIAISTLNIVVFFLMTRNYQRMAPSQVKRRMEFKRAAQASARNARPADATGARHKCAVCGCTELTNPERTFRYCSKCNGNYEYCSEHLYTHVHIQ